MNRTTISLFDMLKFENLGILSQDEKVSLLKFTVWLVDEMCAGYRNPAELNDVAWDVLGFTRNLLDQFDPLIGKAIENAMFVTDKFVNDHHPSDYPLLEDDDFSSSIPPLGELLSVAVAPLVNEL